jgi:hypothetical protein
MNECHMLEGLKKAWRTARLPGANMKPAASSATKANVLTVDTAVERRSPANSRGRRPGDTKAAPTGWPTMGLHSADSERQPLSLDKGGPPYGWIVGIEE